jgi:hypothetical protein
MLFRRAHHFISSRQLPMSKNPMPKKHKFFEIFNDTQTGMLLGIPRSARCVQRFDDSLNSAIHITYRISLRSSSMREPRDPLLKVVFYHLKGWQKPTISFYRHSNCVCEKTHRHPDFLISRERPTFDANLLSPSRVSTKSAQVEKRMKQAAKGVHMLIRASDSLATHFVQ